MKSEQFAKSIGFWVDESGVVFKPNGSIQPLHRSSDKMYWKFDCGPSGNRARVMVHRLQGFQKFGNAIYGTGIQCRHLDGNSENNAKDNIAIGSPSQNQMDRSEEARIRSAIWATSFWRKHDHSAILAHYAQHGFRSTLAKFGITKGTFSFILNKSMAASAVATP